MNIKCRTYIRGNISIVVDNWVLLDIRIIPSSMMLFSFQDTMSMFLISIFIIIFLFFKVWISGYLCLVSVMVSSKRMNLIFLCYVADE